MSTSKTHEITPGAHQTILSPSRTLDGIFENAASIPAVDPRADRRSDNLGEITKIHHDAAIVYAPRPFVLAILVRGLPDIKDSSTLMADITHLLFQAVE